MLHVKSHSVVALLHFFLALRLTIVSLDVLSDSGADISATGQDVLTILGQHIDNIVPSSISPRTVNGLSMTLLGKVPVTIQLGKAMYKDDLHVHPGVSGALSWKTAKGLGMLLPEYPYPSHWSCKKEGPNPHVQVASTTTTGMVSHSTEENIMKQYPTAFDGEIRVMDLDQSHLDIVTS